MNFFNKLLLPLLTATGLAMGIPAADASVIVYEPFDDPDPTLVGNTPGIGLSGTWRGDSRPDIVSPSVDYGSLPSSGNAVFANGSWFGNDVDIDTSPEYNALVADGGEMWFSMLYRVDSGAGRFYYTIGNADVANNGNLVDPGQAIGFGSTGNRVYAGLWETFDWGANNLSAPGASSVDVSGDSIVNNADGGVITSGATHFIVGRAQWGATPGDDDIVSLYMPGIDNVPGDIVAQAVGQVDQSTFNLLATNHGNGLTSTWDEIRIASTYEDLLGGAGVAPEPSTTSLLMVACGLLSVLRRNRKYKYC
jgi:hypothetical protein